MALQSAWRVGLVAVLAALLAWRFSFIIHVFAPVKLPVERFSTFPLSSESKSQCKVLQSHDQRLGYCEDITFWDVHDAQGIVRHRDVVAGCDMNRKSWNTVMGPLRDPTLRGSLWLVRYDSDGLDELTLEVDRENGGARVEEIELESYPDYKDFHPLGLAIWPVSTTSPDGRLESNMFVVNHGRHNSTIEQFILSRNMPANAHAQASPSLNSTVKPTARYIRTITHSLLLSPNALALTSPTSFYVTNDHLFTRRLPGILGKTLPMMETILGLPGGFLLHVDVGGEDGGENSDGRDVLPRVEIAKVGLPFANGIAISPDGGTLAIALTSYALVYTYNRTKAGPKEILNHAHTIHLPFASDNLHYDDSATLLVAGHPNFPHLIDVAANKPEVANAPSWAMEIIPGSAMDKSRDTLPEDPDSKTSPWGSLFSSPYGSEQKRFRRAQARTPVHVLRTIYLSDGTKFGSSATAIRDARFIEDTRSELGGTGGGGTVFIAGLYEHGLLMCQSST